jgi:tripartite ATP-independent transporter DctM subunit
LIIGWMIVALLVLIVLGAPIFLAMGMAGLLHYFDLGRESALVVLTQVLYGGTRSFTFLAIPMFLLAGNLMTHGGLTDRLITLARTLIGHVRGGLGQVNILSSVFFGAISGSAYADVAAMGSVFIPAMKKEGYPAGFAGALTAVSGTLAPMIPPSIILIVYGATFGVSIAALFAAGLSLALLIAVLYSLMAYILSRRYDVPSHPRPPVSEVWGALKAALPSLGMPVVVLGGILGGFFSPTEAAAIAAAYGLILTVVVYRTIDGAGLWRVLLQTSLTTAAIMILVGAALMLTYVMSIRHIPMHTMAFLLGITGSPIPLILLILVILFIAGLFIDRTANVLMFGAIIIPVFTHQAGFSPVHTAMIIVMALGIGHLTPPVGGTLLATSLVGRVSVIEITRYIWPFILLEIAITLLVVFVPAISETLPRLLGLGGL